MFVFGLTNRPGGRIIGNEQNSALPRCSGNFQSKQRRRLLPFWSSHGCPDFMREGCLLHYFEVGFTSTARSKVAIPFPRSPMAVGLAVVTVNICRTGMITMAEAMDVHVGVKGTSDTQWAKNGTGPENVRVIGCIHHREFR